MKNQIINLAILKLSLFLLLFISFEVPAQQNQLRRLENNAFQRGEKISYRVFYDSFLTGNVLAGEATLEVLSKTERIGGRNTMPVVGLGKSKGAFNWFYQVDNRYETYIDEQTIAPMYFMRRIKEGKYRMNQDVSFNQYENTAVSNTATITTVPYVQDIISAVYYLRTYDFKNARVGDTFEVQFYLDDEIFRSRVIFEGREVINTRMGKFKTLRFKPEVATGNVFDSPYPMILWVSDDENKIPILAQSGILLGHVKMEITDYKGLRNPVTSKID